MRRATASTWTPERAKVVIRPRPPLSGKFLATLSWQAVEKLLRSPPASLRSPWRAHVLPRTLRAPGPTAPRIWACSRRFSTPCRVFSLFAFECLLPPGEQVQRFQRGERFNGGAAQLGEALLLGARRGRPRLAAEKAELLRPAALPPMRDPLPSPLF